MVLVSRPQASQPAGIPAAVVPLPGWVMPVDDEDHVLAIACREVVARLGLAAPVLEIHFSEDAMDQTPVLLVLDRSPRDVAAPSGLAWVPIGALGRDAVPVDLAGRAMTWVRELTGEAEVPTSRQSWARPGSNARVATWLDTKLAELGRPRVGPLQQISSWGISMVLRTETASGLIWVKCAMSPFEAEVGVARLLAERFPEAVPRLVAVNESEGWLVMEDLGSTFVDVADEVMRRAASDLLVRIQRDLAGDREALFGTGASKSPLDRLANDLEDAFFGEPQVVAWALSSARHRELVEIVRADVAEIAELGVADSIVHGDFTPWNVAVADGRPVIIDWADASVGFPLIDLATWLNGVTEEATRQRIWLDWVAAWAEVVPAERLASCYRQVLTIGDADHLVDNVRGLRAMEPAGRPVMVHTATDFEEELDRAARLRKQPSDTSRN